MDISKTLFATMVKNARMDRHWTQEELAEKLSVSPTYLGDLERHKGTPSLSLFCKRPIRGCIEISGCCM